MVAMSRPSNPRLMARVLEAVKHLGEGRGSSARQVLEIVRQGNKAPTRNLAMQVQRALKNAVTVGLLQLRGGRYKMLISLQNALKNRGGSGNANKTTVSDPSRRKKEDLKDAADSGSLQPVQAGPRRRCSHCKKHKRRMSRRRRKRSSKRRKRPSKQAVERKSRKLRRRGEEDLSTRRERRKKISAPSPRGQSELPNGQRSERPGKTNPENNQDRDTRESGSRRGRPKSSSGIEDEDEEGPNAAGGKRSGTGRKRSSSRRSGSKPRRSSKKRNSAVRNAAENDGEETRMECCGDDDDDNPGGEIGEEDASARERDANI